MNFRPNKRLPSLIIVGVLVSTAFLVFVPNEAYAAPSFSIPDIDPDYPNATVPVNVSIEITDNQVVTSATLYYSYDGVTWSTTTMNLDSGGQMILFNETFPTTSFNPTNWASTIGSPAINTMGINEPSPPYSMDLNGNNDRVTSVVIDLSSYSNAEINFTYEPGGGGDPPESNNWVYMDYYSSGGSWINCWSQNGGGSTTNMFFWAEVSLPPGAYHSNFRFRFRSAGDSGFDDWFFDNIRVIVPGVKAYGLIPGPGFSTTVYYYVNATNIIGESSVSPTYSYYVDGIKPLVVDCTSVTGLISSEEEVTIFTNVTDDYYLDYVLLWYNNGSGWTSMMMNFVSGNSTNATYQVNIPPARSQTVVDYYIEVLDRAKNSNSSAIKNYSANSPPIITNVENIPEFPKGSSTVTIFANVTDSDGIGSVTLYYSTDGVTFISTPMSLVSGDQYNCTIPPTVITTTIYHYIEATDNNGLLRSTPIFTYLADANPPYFGTPEINPEYPNATVNVNVTMGILDNADVMNATLHYTYDGITWFSVSMADYGISGIFYDYQVETGPSGWTHYQLLGPAGDNWVISSSRWYSPFNSWHSGQEPGSNWGDSCLESPLFTNLPFSANLSFWHWYDFYSFPIDGGIVEINDGSGWTQIFPVNGYDGTLGVGWQNPIEGKQAFTSGSGGWQKETFVLSAYAGKDVRIRFHVGWNNINDGPREGWYIDNITLYSDIGGWSGIIPGPGFSTWVYYYVVASDQANNLNTSQIYSYYADGIPPIVVDTTTVTSPVATNAQISIFANVTDNYGFNFNNVYLWYDNGSGWASLPMTFVTGNYTNATFQAFIPPSITETTVSYYVEIFDNASNNGISITKNYLTNSPPFIDDVAHNPQYPNVSSTVTVFGNITDIDGISSVTLYYSTDGVTYISTPMALIGGNLYNGTIPPLGSAIVYYYILAVDTNGFSNSSPIFNYTVDVSLPEFGTPRIDPICPNATVDVMVSIGITDDTEVKNATLYYSYEGITWTPVGMNLSGGSGGTVQILAFTQYTDMFTEYPNTLTAIGQVTTDYAITEFSDWTQLNAFIGNKDVLLIPEQESANLPIMMNIGSSWATTLINFLNGGGTIIVCDQSGHSYGILTGAGLMTISGWNFITGNPVFVVDPSDPLANGVASSFIAPNGAKRFNTAESNVVIDDGVQPVVVNKAYGAGFIALIGFDYYTVNNFDANQVVGNAVLNSGGSGANGTIPGPGFPTMVYYYINATDASGNSNESLTYSYLAGSDLIITPENITFNPIGPIENGTAIQINAIIFNSGGSLVGVEVRYYDGDPDKDNNNVIDAGAIEIGIPSVLNFNANSIVNTSTVWIPSERGFYDVYVWVDAPNATWEWKESNNLACSKMDVYDWLDDFLNETKIDDKYNVAIINGDATLLNLGGNISVTGTSYYWNIGGLGNDYYAQSFVPTESLIGSVGIYIGGDFLPYPDMRVQLWGDLGGNPDKNNVIASSDIIKGSTITFAGQRYYINFSIPLSVTIGQTYWIVIDGYYDHNTTGRCYARYRFGNIYPNGIFKRSDDAGASWFIPSSNYDLDFIVEYYDPVSDGNLRSVEITLPFGKKWKTLYVNKTELTNTYIQVSVANGTTDAPIPGFVDITDRIIDISSIDPDKYPTIKLVGKLFGDGIMSPVLHYWAVNWVPGPRGDAGPDDNVNEDVTYEFDGSGSWSDIGIANYAWDMDASDGLWWETGALPDDFGLRPTQIYNTPGLYVVTLNVTDINGYWDTDTMILTVIDTTNPVANAGPDREIDEDSPHTFDASASWDNSGNITSYLWDIDDSDGIDWNNPDYTGVSPTHIFTEPGTYTVTLNVTDATGNWKLDTITIKVRDITAPFADAGLDGSIKEDETYYFDCSRSTDNVGIVFYNWTFGDGSYQFGANKTPFHTYSSDGWYVVTLKVTDMAGNWNEDSLTIFVNNVAPVADAGEDQFIDAGQIVEFNGSKSWDTPSDLPSLMYIWYFDDGFVGAGKVTTHTYTSLGVYDVILEVTDDDGAKSSDKITITMRDATWPTANAGQDDSVDRNEPCQFDGSASTDDVGITKYQWDIDDGDGVDWTSPDYEGVSPTHVFAEPGDYVVTLRVIDTDGNFGTDTVTITVLETWPTANAGQDDSVDQNKPYQFDGSASTDDVGITKYQWDIDDSDGVDWASPDYEGVSPTHVFTEPGDYVVTLRVIDTDGNFNTDTIIITVLEVPVEETIPSPPTDLKVSLLPQNDALEISWKAPTTNEDGSTLTDLEYYEIFYWSLVSQEFRKICNVSGKMTSYIHSGLTPNAIYYYYVVAVDKDSSRSQPSAIVSGIPNMDTDGDQIPDITDDDDDNDGYPDIMEIIGGSDPRNALSMPPDNDDDFITDFMDPDDDNDDHPDIEDDYPLDPNKWKKSEPVFDWLWVLLGLIVILMCIIGLLVWKTFGGLEKGPQEVQPKDMPVIPQEGIGKDSRGFPPPPSPEETHVPSKAVDLLPLPPPPPPLSTEQVKETTSQEDIRDLGESKEEVEGPIEDEPSVSEQQPPRESEMEKELLETPIDKYEAQGEKFPFPPPPPPLFTEKIEKAIPQEDLKDVEEIEEEVEWIIEEETTPAPPPPPSNEQTTSQKDLERGEKGGEKVDWIIEDEQSPPEQPPKENLTEEELPEQPTDEPEEED